MKAYWRSTAPLFGALALSLAFACTSSAAGPSPRVGVAFHVTGVHRHHDRVVVIHRRPPMVRIEVRTRRPGRRHVWLGGHWQYRRGRYVWVKGRWAVPPRRGLVYVRPTWKRHGGGYVFVVGGWR